MSYTATATVSCPYDGFFRHDLRLTTAARIPGRGSLQIFAGPALVTLHPTSEEARVLARALLAMAVEIDREELSRIAAAQVQA